MSTVESLPKGLSASTFERGALSKHNIPPIRFVPDDKQYVGWGSRKPHMVKVNFAFDVAKEYPQLITGTMEDAVKAIQSHDKLVREKKVADKVVANHEKVSSLTKELNQILGKRPLDVRVDELRSEITALNTARQELKEAPFNLLGQMLGADLQTKLEVIIAQECDSADYVDLDGKKADARARQDYKVHARVLRQIPSALRPR